MSLRRTNIWRFARAIAILLTSLGLPSLAIGLGCGDNVMYPPPSGPPNDTTMSGGSAVGDAGTPDLCACAVALGTNECLACNEKVASGGMACEATEGTCANSLECVSNAQCIGGCLKDAATPEPDCVSGCLGDAGAEYLAYLKCICRHCATCTSQFTCPAP
jgi:hypothetical protein